jgi:hypothetical protein
MAWGKAIPSGSAGVGAGPFAANYNRGFDTGTRKGSNGAFAVNPPAYADEGPYEYSGLGPDPIERAYRNPTNRAPDQGFHGAPYGYLGDTVGPREIQTGNAPSGGYMTDMVYSVGFQKGAIPDNRRVAERTRPDDWEARQGPIHARRDAETRSRRAANVRESWVEFDTLPMPIHQINAVEDSPYRKDWSDAHMGPGGAGGSATYRTNPNRFRNFDRYDFATDRATSGARYLNGTHYSMAVHQTLTPYGPSTDGANPVRAGRNTFIATPAPWDSTNTDGPANTPGYMTTANLSNGPSQGLPSYRLM